jgi:MATE family multidrug resistance protein
MRRPLSQLRPEIGPMLSLALPVALGELAWMAMGVADAVMVGRVSPEALGALSVGRSVFILVAVFGIGLLLGLDTVVSQSFGAGDLTGCVRSMVQGAYLSLALVLPLGAAYLGSLALLPRIGIEPAVLGATVPYMKAIGWSLFPLLLYTTFRRYLQAINLVRPVMIALVTANLVNVAGNWILIYGRLGAPPLGAAGAGWATCLSIGYMALFLWVAVVLHGRENPASAPRRLAIDPARLHALVRLGLPAAVHVTLEVGVFTLVTVLAGRLDAASLAAHQVALTVASVTFMVPLGISSAGAVRVGQAVGRGDPRAAARAGWTAMLLATAFMAVAALALVAVPRPIMRLFSDDVRVIEAGRTLLLVAAMFQLFDGLQVAATGALRGLGDTRNPMLWNLVGYWVFGLPVGYGLCFHLGMGVLGLWLGLCLGLVLVAGLLLGAWCRRIRRLARSPHRR